jgi:hypothetical protein
MIEYIVDLNKELHPLSELIVAAQIQDSVTRGKALAKIVNAIRLTQVILVAPRVGSTSRDEIKVYKDLRGWLVIDVRFQ